MAVQYYYNYAEIDPTTNMCIAVITTTSDDSSNPVYVPIPVYDEEYILKYYINGAWYEDAAGTIPWTSSLI
jgi:hypothetical protein